MDIPYTVQPRPETGLYNAKVGIWLFLASEVMLFGGLFSGYVLLRVGADQWPHGWLNVTLGTANTIILALSAITTLLAWVACKVGHFGKFKFFHACTLLLALSFLCIKGYEYHDKWIHYEIKLNDGTFADGHLVEKSADFDLAKKTGTFTMHGRIVTDENDLYDLRSQKNIQLKEITVAASRHQVHGKLRPVAQHVSGALLHAHRPARAAHPRRQHCHRLFVGAGPADVEDRSPTFHQPHRGVRPVLAFRGPRLDISVPSPIFDLMNI